MAEGRLNVSTQTAAAFVPARSSCASSSPLTLLDRRLCYGNQISPSAGRCVSCNGVIALLKWIRERPERTAPSGCSHTVFDHIASGKISKRPTAAGRSVVGRTQFRSARPCEESLRFGRAGLGDSFREALDQARTSARFGRRSGPISRQHHLSAGGAVREHKDCHAFVLSAIPYPLSDALGKSRWLASRSLKSAI